MSPHLLNGEDVQADAWDVATGGLTDCCLLVQHLL